MIPLLLTLASSAEAATLDQAREAREAGDYAGAIAFLEAVHPLLEPDDEGRWQLERGLDEELSWRPDLAEPYYRAAIETGGDAGLEGRYHLVVILDDLGRVDEARAELKALRGAHGIAKGFQPVLQAQAGVLDIHDGRLGRGVREVRQAFASDESGAINAWMQARARYAMLDAWTDAADGLDFSGRETAQKRNLKKRVLLMRDAEAEMYTLFKTGEPEWITASLLRMGRSYEDLSVDLAATAAPKRLTDEQERVFREEIGKKAEAPRTKAFNCFDKGVEVAARLNFSNPTVDTLREERDRLAAVR